MEKVVCLPSHCAPQGFLGKSTRLSLSPSNTHTQDASPGDRQLMPGLYQAYQRGQTHFQVGDNNNLFDYTYVGNIAQAHLLAADKLVDPASSDKASTDGAPADSALRSSLHKALPPISATLGFQRVPTCNARPLGPYVTPPPNAETIEAAFNAPHDPSKPTHVIVRNRFDQFADNALDVAPTNPLQVAGQAFFITNGEPVYFWDFARRIWLALDPPTEEGRKRAEGGAWVIPRQFGMVLGYLGETWAWLIGKDAGFTRYRVGYSCATRYHNIEKARRVLGYEPEVGLEEGVRRMVEVRVFVCVYAQCRADDRFGCSGSRRRMVLHRRGFAPSFPDPVVTGTCIRIFIYTCFRSFHCLVVS